MTNDNNAHILLVDDIEENLQGLVARLGDLLPQGVVVDTWLPENDEESSLEDEFDRRISPQTMLVVTDYDLTTRVKGFLGLSIVAWCQKRSIPVGDFSRGHIASLPDDPNLFELRVPPEEDLGAAFIAAAFRGFQTIDAALRLDPAIIDQQRSLATVLAQILKRPRLESQFSIYMSRLGAANAGLFQTLRQLAAPDGDPDRKDKIKLLTYVLGHVLANAVLKYPGPILSVDALCAYLACNTSEIDALNPIFDTARYDGPFDTIVSMFWREDVDAIIEKNAEGVDLDGFPSFADFNRAVVGRLLNRPLAPHACERCEGLKGGYWCPFTKRAVCERADCSVPSSSWIPQGAQLCRVERDFYNEWAPLLGM